MGSEQRHFVDYGPLYWGYAYVGFHVGLAEAYALLKMEALTRKWASEKMDTS